MMPLFVSKLTLPLIAATSVLMTGGAYCEVAITSSQEATDSNSVEKKKGKKEPRVHGEATVIVTAEAQILEQVNTRVSTEVAEVRNAADVSEALALLPGLTFQMNSRGEKIIYVRGLEPRRVPVYLDGIPSYVPYNGQMDFAHFSTFDIEEIQVAKGFSSVILGPNTLGGAINLISKKPRERFEGNATMGATDGNGKRAALNIGSAHDRFFVQAGGSLREQGDFRMSSDFVPTVREDGKRRDNSDFKDTKMSAKIGFAPNSNSEYVIGFMSQRGEKGTPRATDTSERENLWRMPNWDKDNVYILSHIGIGLKSYFKIRAYHDTYKNTLNVYKDATYTEVLDPGQRGVSVYDDFSDGAAIEFGTTALKNHNLRASVQLRMDAHRSIDDPGTPRSTAWKNVRDEITSIGIEDTVTVNESLHLTAGLALDRQKAIETDVYEKVGTQSFLQGQAGAFWSITDKTMGYLTFAKKGKFPTLSDRYSTRFDRYLVNPDLESEQSMNYDIGIKSSLLPWLVVEGALFYASITNSIESITVQASPRLDQMQNIGKVRNQGIELTCYIKPTSWFESGIYYTYLDRKILSGEDTLRLRGVPRSRLTGFAKVAPSQYYFAFASVESQDAMWDSSLGRIDRSSYTTANLTIGVTPFRGVSFEGGFLNILDKDYQLSVGHPLPGRTWFVNGRYKF